MLNVVLMLNYNVKPKFFSWDVNFYFFHKQQLLLQQPCLQQPHVRIIGHYRQEQRQSLQQRLRQAPLDLLQNTLRFVQVRHQMMIKIC